MEDGTVWIKVLLSHRPLMPSSPDSTEHDKTRSAFSRINSVPSHPVSSVPALDSGVATPGMYQSPENSH